MKALFFPPLKKMIYTEAVKQEVRKMLAAAIPENALAYALALWEENPFSFKITATRSTCLGNYSFRNGKHLIAINNDLNPYQFLITYVHEVAHQRVFIDYYGNKKKLMPHGGVWQREFQKLFLPILNETVFPPDILLPLVQHMQAPAASSVRDGRLMAALRAYDTHNSSKNVVLLEHLEDGTPFQFRQKVYTKIATRRTRVLCEEKQTRRRYLISQLAEIIPLN